MPTPQNQHPQTLGERPPRRRTPSHYLNRAENDPLFEVSICLTVLGVVVLRFSPYARKRNWLWQVGASLHRLLLVVELSKEFKDFFDNTEEPGEPLKLHN